MKLDEWSGEIRMSLEQIAALTPWERENLVGGTLQGTINQLLEAGLGVDLVDKVMTKLAKSFHKQKDTIAARVREDHLQ